MARKHYHITAYSGIIIEHSHTTPGQKHEHDGMRLYATSRAVIEFLRDEYLAKRKEYLKQLHERANERTQHNEKG